MMDPHSKIVQVPWQPYLSLINSLLNQVISQEGLEREIVPKFPAGVLWLEIA